MLYTKYAFLEDLLKKAINFDKIDIKTFTKDNFEDVFDCSDLDDGWDYQYGASKLVIIPEHLNFVVKIPFGADEWGSSCDPFKSAYYPKEKEYGWDYCKSEAEYFKLAEKAGVSFFFAKTTYIGSISGVPIYAQEKIDIQDDCYSRSYSDEERSSSRKKAIKMGMWNCDFNDDFLAELFTFYSDSEVAALFDFIRTYQIRDLTSHNVGYDHVTGAPVLSDYSNFNE